MLISLPVFRDRQNGPGFWAEIFQNFFFLDKFFFLAENFSISFFWEPILIFGPISLSLNRRTDRSIYTPCIKTKFGPDTYFSGPDTYFSGPDTYFSGPEPKILDRTHVFLDHPLADVRQKKYRSDIPSVCRYGGRKNIDLYFWVYKHNKNRKTGLIFKWKFIICYVLLRTCLDGWSKSRTILTGIVTTNPPTCIYRYHT